MRKIAVIYGGHAPHYRTFHEPKYAQFIDSLIYQLELKDFDLTGFDVLIVPSQLNGEILLDNKEKIYDFANQGGIIVVMGPQPWNWLPDQKWEERPTNFWWWLEENPSSGLVAQNIDHEFFNYISLEDSTWHQHGVFWPPEHAQTLIATEDGGSVLYVDEQSTEGTWVIMTLDPDYHYGSYFMPATERFLDGLFPWLYSGEFKRAK